MEVLNNYQRKKLDESNDEEFYSEPKFVYHLDENFRQNLSSLYKKEISDCSTVLDLMSSWDSYLPKDKKYKKVIGHGLNKKELEKNKIFDSYWIQNFNFSQEIPLENGTIDYCLMVAAWQYLQYPESLTRDISRVLSNKGKIIISFSNRAFWHKAPNIWTTSTEEERVNYVRKVLITNGFNEPKIIKRFNEQTINMFNFFKKDPFYCLIATKE
ncbi:class I SAM-dependent methyltransferase [Prochlorococcus sp. AH-716-D22]|nr:class I SAM-dependent methyltransferase [Prochlorococcus sp. AH-716-D22]